MSEPIVGAGDIFAGRYKRLGRLGTGGMASVFLAEDQVLGREVAVKRLHSASPEDLQQRFRREARMGAALNHPNVVVIFDSVAEDDSLYIVMEYVKGESLDARVDRGRVQPELALGILEQSAAGLDHVHSQGIVHRDIKPSNLMVREDGVVKIADLGIATATGDSAITVSGSVMGTLPYMAPERLRGDSGGPPSDIYSLAAVAFELIGGHRAIQATTPEEAVRLASAPEAPDLRSVWADAPPALAETLRRAMSATPGERHTSACALIGELEDALDKDGATTSQLAAATIPFSVIAEPETAPVRGRAASLAAAAAAEKAEAAGARSPRPPEPRFREDPPTAPRRRVESHSPPPSSPPAGRKSSRAALALTLGGMAALALVIFAIASGGDGDGDGNSASSGSGNQNAQTANEGSGTTDSGGSSGQTETTPEPQPEPEPEPAPEPATVDTVRASELNDEGFALLQSGDSTTALPLLEEAYSLYPRGSSDTTYSFILYNLGTALVQEGRGEEAIPYLEERLERFDDRDATVQMTLDEALAQAGQSPSERAIEPSEDDQPGNGKAKGKSED